MTKTMLDEIVLQARDAAGRSDDSLVWEAIRVQADRIAVLEEKLLPFSDAANEMRGHEATLRIYLPGNASYGGILVRHFREARVALVGKP